MTKILALGYLPKWKGGSQKTGLATGLFDLHDAVNGLHNDCQVVIAATDIFKPEVMIDNTKVIGWSKIILFKNAINHFYRLPKFVFEALKMARYKPVSNFASSFAKILFLDYAITREKPDIIHLHGCYYAMFRKAIWNKSMKVVLRLHGINGFDETIFGHEQYQQMERYITSLPFEFVTFVTTGICEEWKARYGEFKSNMIPLINGYNSSVFHLPNDIIPKKYDLVTFSGLSERKGQDRVIKALKKLKEEGISLSYLVIGSGIKEYEMYLHQLVKETGTDVEFISYLSQNKILPYLWKCRYFILPSVTEGFGKVFIESAGSGLPVILPKTLPIVQEQNVMTTDNCILTDDETVDSIYKVLKSLPDYMFDSTMVAQSVLQLKWSSLACQYVKLYQNIII